MLTRLLFSAVFLSLLTACPPPTPGDAGPDGGPVAEAFFPDDVETAFTEVRDCRNSIEHDLVFIRVFADELAHDPYTTHDGGFPEGATVVKAEYADDGCTDLVGYTAMQKLVAGASPDALDWRWQEADANRRVSRDGALLQCIGCHERCEGGYDGACTEP